MSTAAQQPTADWKSQLADLHTPPEPSVWPPSAWVFLLLGIAMILLGLLIVSALRRWREGAWKRQALRELKALSPNSKPQLLSQLLRRVARHRFGPSSAALGDQEFSAFLHDTSMNQIPLDVSLRLASCAHLPGMALESRDLEAAHLWIRAC